MESGECQYVLPDASVGGDGLRPEVRALSRARPRSLACGDLHLSS
jgi:hypothetical protein